MSDENPFVDEKGARLAQIASGEPVAIPSSTAAPGQPTDSVADTAIQTAEAKTNSAAISTTPDPKPAMKVKTKIEFDVMAEPYAAGRCTIILALAIRPDDGHPDGRLVVLAARSHDEAPVLATARLNTLQLPEALTRVLAEYQAQLPRRGVLEAEARAKEEAEKKAAEERHQASCKGAATAKAKHSTAAKPETKPATTKPAAKPASTQVSLFGAGIIPTYPYNSHVTQSAAPVGASQVCHPARRSR